MGNTITEYIGKDKLLTTGPNPYYIRQRYQTPQPGDVVDFGPEYKLNRYPYNSAQHGRIDSGSTWGIDPDKEVFVCLGGGSVFYGLRKDQEEKYSSLNKVYTSISGGPFAVIPLSDLEPTYTLELVRFWNWGNNGAGAGHGTDYYIKRPVFRWQDRSLSPGLYVRCKYYNSQDKEFYGELWTAQIIGPGERKAYKVKNFLTDQEVEIHHFEVRSIPNPQPVEL